MGQPVTDDEEDFVAPVAPAKGEEVAPKPRPKKIVNPVDEVSDEPLKPKFHPRLMKAAEEYGLSPEEIDSCDNASDLKYLIDLEREKTRETRAKQMGSSGAGRDGSRAGTAPDPEVPAQGEAKPSATAVPAEDSEWKFLEDLESQGYDPKLLAEMKRFGKELLGLRKNSSQEKLEALQKQFDEHKASIEQMQLREHPLTRRIKSVIAKYPSLFGNELNEFGWPPEGTPEFRRAKTLNSLLEEMHKSGQATNVPEKDIPAAIASHWPGTKAGAAEAEDETETPKAPSRTPPPAPAKKAGTTRADDWNDSGQAPAVNRNGAARSGVPSTKGAVAVVAKKLRERGIDPGVISEEDEDDDF